MFLIKLKFEKLRSRLITIFFKKKTIKHIIHIIRCASFSSTHRSFDLSYFVKNNPVQRIEILAHFQKQK